MVEVRVKSTVEYVNEMSNSMKCVTRAGMHNVPHDSNHEIVPEAIIKMKQEPGRDMVIYGSASIVRKLTNLGLIDRYQLLVYPVALGSGKPLWSDILHTMKLSLVSTTTHPSGVVELSYQPIYE